MPSSFPHLLIVLVAIILATRLLGEAAQRIGQPAVLGELVAGVLLGGSVFGILQPTDPIIHALSEIGVIVLLFEIGLHTDLKSLAAVGSSALTVALVGVAVPFALGYWVTTALGLFERGTQGALRFEVQGIVDGEPRIVVEHVTRIAPGGTFGPHIDEYAHVFCVLEGRGEVMLGKQRGKVEPGMVFTSEIREPHGIWAAEDTELVLVAANVYPAEA